MSSGLVADTQKNSVDALKSIFEKSSTNVGRNSTASGNQKKLQESVNLSINALILSIKSFSLPISEYLC